MTETTTNLDFPTALKYCFKGKRIRNLNWNGKNMYVYAVEGKSTSEAVFAPFLMMCNAKGEFVPWLISQMDVFSRWVVIE